MAAPTETAATPGRGKSRAESRRAERAPSGGWRTIAAKEIADHIASWRFFILLLVIAILFVMPMYFSSVDIQAQATAASGSPLAFLALFTHGAASFGGFALVSLAFLEAPVSPMVARSERSPDAAAAFPAGPRAGQDSP